MSSTRYAPKGAPLRQHRYASAPEYAELRGAQGGLVASKAAWLGEPRKRSLLFFLQALSMREGGFKALARELVAMFPQRAGTRAMHQAGIKPGGKFPRDVAREVHRELFLNPVLRSCHREQLDDADESGEIETSVDELLAVCRGRAEGALPGELMELCINPEVQFCLPEEPEEVLDVERRAIEEADEQVTPRNYRKLGIRCFQDLAGALLEYQRRYTVRVRESFVETSISRRVWETLDFCLERRRMALIEGLQGIGKTEAVKAWCEMHLGEARLVSLSGIANKTGVFRDIAKACGLPCTYALTATDSQMRVEDFLQRSGLVLIVDEAHFLMGQSVRIASRPELIDWVDTALFNHGVPTCLVSTPQFSNRLEFFETKKSIQWNGAQFWRRVKRRMKLDQHPTVEDLKAVAAGLLPQASKALLAFVVGHAASHPQPMDELVDTIEEARHCAAKAGREQVALSDLQHVIAEYRQTSGLVEMKPASKKPGRRAVTPLQLPGRPPAMVDDELVPTRRFAVADETLPLADYGQHR